MNFELKVRGRYRIDVIKPSGEKVVAADWFDNLITDSGLDLIGSSGSYLNACAVGTGSATPANTDTSLGAIVADSNVIIETDSGSDISGGFSYTRRTYEFSAGEAAGNISEVGISANFSNSPIFSRALIKDPYGNPTTITILSDEVLQVTYECRIYWPTGQFSGATTGGIAWTAQAIRVASSSYWSNPGSRVLLAGYQYCKAYTGGLPSDGDIENSLPEGTGYSMSSGTTDAYIPGTYEITGEMFWDLSSANDTLKTFMFKIVGGGAWAFELDSQTINKTSNDELRVRFRVGWGRY